MFFWFYVIGMLHINTFLTKCQVFFYKKSEKLQIILQKWETLTTGFDLKRNTHRHLCVRPLPSADRFFVNDTNIMEEWANSGQANERRKVPGIRSTERNKTMAATVTVKTTADLLREVYRNVKMAEESIINLMPKVKDEKLKSAMTVQLSTYEAFASRASKLLGEEGVKPEDESMFTKMSAKWGILVNTLKDSSTPHLIQMMLEGTNMGVGELLRLIRESENSGVSEASLRLARDVCAFEEKSVEDLKQLLK